MSVASDRDAILAALKELGSEHSRAGMARFGINTASAFGVSITAIRPLARQYRGKHDLALALWKTGRHEARILAAFIDNPALATPEQMDAWAGDLDSWDLCDQAAIRLFARTPFAIAKVAEWADDEREFVRRAAFATIAGYAVSAKKAPDSDFLPFFALIAAHATDSRNFVRKAVNWALRQIGKRSPSLHGRALKLATKLAASEDRTARWIGKDAVRELTDPAQVARIAKRGAARR